MKFLPSTLALVALLAFAGCKPHREITSLQRKEAATLASEAQFAMSLRDFSRTEGLLTKAVALCTDTGDFWVDLAAVRMRQGNRDGAKNAYRSALSAYEEAYKQGSENTEAILQQVFVLASLGRVDDARALLEKARKQHPDDRTIQDFVRARQLDSMLVDPHFKETAL